MSLDKQNRQIKGLNFDEDTDSLHVIRNVLAEITPGIHREKVYPFDSVGTTITCGIGAWGATKILVPIDGIFDNYGWEASGTPLIYAWVGVNLISVSDPSKQATLQFFRIPKTTVEILDQDSGVSQVNKNRVYVGSTALFKVDDRVWLTDDDTSDGEIGKVTSIVEDDYITLAADLTNDYTVAQNAKVYLIRRVTEDDYRCIWLGYSAVTTKEILPMRFHAARQLQAGDGILCRGYCVDAADPEINVVVVYDDGEVAV